MSYTYDRRRRAHGKTDPAPERTSAPGPDHRALTNETARTTAAQKGRSIDLDAAIRARMEHAFGDLSAVKLYESPAVGQAGAEAVAQGNEIAFAPGMADFTTRSGHSGGCESRAEEARVPAAAKQYSVNIGAWKA